MSIIDQRLLSLLETLTEAGADWLAFELIDGIQRGREALESEGDLQAAREKVRDRYPQSSDRARSGESPFSFESPRDWAEPSPIHGDDQIKWAAKFVNDRLVGLLQDMSGAFDNLHAIVDVELPQPPVARTDRESSPVVIALKDGEAVYEVRLADVTSGQTALRRLQTALVSWESRAVRQLKQ